MRIKLCAGLAVCGWMAVIGCLDDSITGTRTLSIEITVDPTTAAVDEVVTAQYSVGGIGIFGVIVDWGDGVLDTISFAGVVEAEGPVDHQYSAAGAYDIIGTVGAQNGVLSAQTSVVIN
jgi:hypothetical protein